MSKPASNALLSYQVAIEAITTHTFSISLSVKSDALGALTLEFASWIPGSYMIRDFAKNIMAIEAENSAGAALPIVKTDKQTWRVEQLDQQTTIRYQVYAFDLSVRSAFIDKEFAFVNGTSIFPRVLEFEDAYTEVHFVPVASMPKWRMYTAMSPVKRTKKGYGVFSATGYRDLIEHPILYSQGSGFQFDYQDVTFEMVFAGGHNADLARIETDLKKIVQHHVELFGGDLPVDRYLFMTMLTDKDFGGLEHTYSTALMFSRQDLPSIAQRENMPKGYISFLSLCSHEFLHTWHVKRTRPQVYMTPDLSKEVYTEQLWIYEGFTSYYDDLSLVRAEIISHEEYLQLIGKQLTRLQRNPGNAIQTVTESSFDAWTKFYKQDENAANAIVSYYTKGAMIALCLDLKIRQESKNKKSLDHLLLALWQQYGSENRGTENDVIHQLLSGLISSDLSGFINELIYTTESLPVEALLSEFGVTLNLRARSNAKDPGGNASESNTTRDFGAVYSISNSGYLIKSVLNGHAAQQAGLQKDDLIIALNGWQLNGSDIETLLAKEPLHSKVTLSIFRRGRLTEQTLRVEEAKPDTVYLSIANKKKISKWLGANNDSLS